MLLGESGGVIQKAGAALSKDRDHGVRNESLCLDGQTEPIGKSSPLDEFGDVLRKTVKRKAKTKKAAKRTSTKRRPAKRSAKKIVRRKKK
jgi:hypothetical protein